MSLKHTREIIDAIHSGELEGAETEPLPLFGLQARGPVFGAWRGLY
jgi:phosphoenolpyruvate carboxykinase (ATP)